MSVPKMFVHVRFEDETLDRISNECGLVIPTTNDLVATAELQFFAEAIIKECIMTVLGGKPEEGPVQG